MNFDPYKSRSQLAAPAANFTKPAPLQYDNSGERALVKANAETGLVIAEGFNKWREQYDQGKVMEANNEYNRLMSEGTAELMQRKEEAALNIVQDYDKLHQKTMDQINKKYGQFIRFGKAAEAFNVYTGRDNNTRRQNMMKYQMAETDKFHETQYQNQLATCQQMVMDGGGTDQAIDAAFNRGLPLLQSRFANYGPEKVAEQERLFKGQLISGALQMAVSMEDYSRMGAIASKYNNYLDAKTRVSVLSMLGKRQKDAHDFAQANNLWVQLGENATLDDYRNYFRNLYANSGNSSARFSHYDSMLGQEMPNGRNGCVEGFIRLTAPFFKFSADNSGEVNVGSICRLAENTDGVRLERYHGGAIPEGSGIIYFSKGDDISNLDNAEHITMADGGGGFYGNSSSAKDYEDENGNYVRGNGCIVHADDQEIGGYEIGYIIRMDSQTMKEMSDLEVEEKAQKAWALHTKKEAEIKAANNKIISTAKDEMQDLMNHGVDDVEQYKAIVNKYAYVDGTINKHIQVELEKTVAAIERRNERATEQAARRQPSVKVDEDDMDYLREEISKGNVTQNDIINYCAERGITAQKEINKCTKMLKEYMENKGEWAIPYKEIKEYCGIDENNISDKPKFDLTFKKVCRWQYKEMLRENNGQLQEGWEQDLEKRVRDSYEKEFHGSAPYRPQSSWGITPDFIANERVEISNADLTAAGYIAIEPASDGDEYWLLREDGTKTYMTGEQVMALKGMAGYAER